MLEIFHPEASHKYLGRKLCIHPELRCDLEIQHRIQIAWMRFHKHRAHMTDKHIPIFLRLKIFDSVIIPTLFFVLVTLPLSTKNINRLNSTVQKMLRAIVGWVRVSGEEWESTIRRMKIRIQNAMNIYIYI